MDRHTLFCKQLKSIRIARQLTHRARGKQFKSNALLNRCARIRRSFERAPEYFAVRFWVGQHVYSALFIPPESANASARKQDTARSPKIPLPSYTSICIYRFGFFVCLKRAYRI